jgi:beta-phosphoglucomutase
VAPYGIDDPVRAIVEQWGRRPRRAVIFDFNGTLSDDEPLLLRLYREMFEEHLQWVLGTAHYYSVLAGMSDREIIETVVTERTGGDPTLVTLLLDERRLRYRRLVEEESPILPDTIEMVRWLRSGDVPLGIVTGAQRDDVDFVLAHSPLAGFFPIIVAEEDVAHGKPDPEGFVTAIERLAVDPSDVLVFEDSLHGIAAARSAGAWCIAVEGTRSRAELVKVADGVVPRLVAGIFAS